MEQDPLERLKIYKLLKKCDRLEFLVHDDDDCVVAVMNDPMQVLCKGVGVFPFETLTHIPPEVQRLQELIQKQPDPDYWGHVIATVSRWASARKLFYRTVRDGVTSPPELWTRKDRKVPKVKTYPKGSFNDIVNTVPDFNLPKWRAYFEFLTLRMEVWHKKDVLKENPPWTDDLALQNYFFTNIYRELDKNTRFELEFLGKTPDPKEQLRKILIFRQNNSRHVFELLMTGPSCKDFISAYDELKAEGKGASRAMIINTPRFTSVRDWTWTFYDWVQENIDRVYDELLACIEKGPETSYEYFLTLPRVGNFFAYEYYTSLTYTDWFPFNEDSFVWCGPGAAPGLEYILELPQKCLKRDRDPAKEYVHQYSETVKAHLRHNVPDFRWVPKEYQPKATREPYKFTRRTFEHSLCEYRKWVNTSVETKRCRRRPYTPTVIQPISEKR